MAAQAPRARRDVELTAVNETWMGGTGRQTDSFFLHMFPGVDSRLSAASLAQASPLLSQAEPFARALFCAVQRLGALASDNATHPGTARRHRSPRQRSWAFGVAGALGNALIFPGTTLCAPHPREGPLHSLARTPLPFRHELHVASP